jgi:hypothetical protein
VKVAKNDILTKNGKKTKGYSTRFFSDFDQILKFFVFDRISMLFIGVHKFTRFRAFSTLFSLRFPFFHRFCHFHPV